MTDSFTQHADSSKPVHSNDLNIFIEAQNWLDLIALINNKLCLVQAEALARALRYPAMELEWAKARAQCWACRTYAQSPKKSLAQFLTKPDKA